MVVSPHVRVQKWLLVRWWIGNNVIRIGKGVGMFLKGMVCNCGNGCAMRFINSVN